MKTETIKIPNILLIFIWKGMMYWVFVGFLVGITSFKFTLPIEVIQQSEKLNVGYNDFVWFSTWFSICLKISVMWAVCGGIVGALICLVFTSKPLLEHNTLIPTPRYFSALPMFRDLRTMAEIKTTPFSVAIALMASLLMSYFALPLVQSSELIVINSSLIPKLIVSVQAIFMSILILPSSLKIFEKLIISREFN